MGFSVSGELDTDVTEEVTEKSCSPELELKLSVWTHVVYLKKQNDKNFTSNTVHLKGPETMANWSNEQPQQSDYGLNTVKLRLLEKWQIPAYGRSLEQLLIPEQGSYERQLE